MGDLLTGKVVAVTGAGRGIGRSVAIGLASEGASVMVNDLGVNPDGTGVDHGPARRSPKKFGNEAGTAVPDTSDIATMAGGQAVVRTAVSEFGRIDILVNVAGIFRHNYIFEMPEADWDAVLAVHLKGHFACVHAALPHMREFTFSSSLTSSALQPHGTGQGAGVTRGDSPCHLDRSPHPPRGHSSRPIRQRSVNRCPLSSAQFATLLRTALTAR